MPPSQTGLRGYELAVISLREVWLPPAGSRETTGGA